MNRKRVIAAIGAALGIVAIIPAASAAGSGNVPFRGDRDVQAATALGTGFTYQGRLTDAGSPANGAYDLRFILYDAETGGAQVGTVTATKDDVQVVNGLFSVDLDFGATAFNGDARWLEIAVRPGTSTATHTVLSPRQPVSPTPYALYAKAAGSIALPFAATAAAAGVSGNSTGLLTVTQSGTGIALSGQRTTVDPADFPAVVGTNSGGGAAVQGISTFATGTGGKFSGTTGVEVDGAIKVSGTSKAAFTQTVVIGAATTCLGNQAVLIDKAITNGDPNALLLVTQNLSAAGPVLPVAALYSPATCAIGLNKWVLYADTAFTAGQTFNVLVIKQ